MKKIIFDELNIFNIILFFVFRVFGYRVFFLKVSSFLRKQNLLIRLEKIDIIKINFNNSKFLINQNYNLKRKKSIIQSKLLAKNNINRIWSKKLERIFLNKTYLEILLFNHFKYELWDRYILFEFGSKIQQNKEKIYFWTNKDLLNNLATTKYKNFKILKPVFLNFFSNFIFIFGLILVKIKNKYYKTAFKRIKHKKVSQLKIKTDKKTIFFINAGIVSGNSNYLDKKNFFFSREKKDVLNKDNIEICELYQNLDKKSLSFYKKFKIDVVFWFNKKTLSPFKGNIILLSSLLSKTSFRFDLKLGFKIFIFALNVLKNIKRLDEYKNVKNAIIENEIQFPTTLAIALKHKDIKISCFSKRLILPAWHHQVIIDNYFLIGNKTNDYLKLQLYKNIKPIFIGGRESLKTKYSSKYLLSYKRKFSLICLVLDYHSDKDWYKSSLNPIVNYANNLKFYKSILSISNSHPEILFVLKSKNYNWVKIPFFKDIYKKIENQKNIIFFNKDYQITNFQMIKNVDFSIAKYTSLVDDFLMNHKPSIIYEEVPFVKDFINYDKSIIVENEEDLHKTLTILKKNYVKFNSNLNFMRKSFYRQFNLTNCQNKLRNIIG